MTPSVVRCRRTLASGCVRYPSGSISRQTVIAATAVDGGDPPETVASRCHD